MVGKGLPEAFNALPPARQQVYRDLSQNSMQDAKAQRAALALVAQDTQESQVRSSSPGNTAWLVRKMRNVRFLNLHPVAWGSACCKTCCGTATACLIKPLDAA